MVVVVVFVVRRTCTVTVVGEGGHVSVDMNARDAPNYGGRVPVDTAHGPAPVCRALKTHPISSSPRR